MQLTLVAMMMALFLAITSGSPVLTDAPLVPSTTSEEPFTISSLPFFVSFNVSSVTAITSSVSANASMLHVTTTSAPSVTSPLPTNSSTAAPDLPTATAVWTMRDFRRQCDKEDTMCEWSFKIDTHQLNNPPTSCKFLAFHHHLAPASRSPFRSTCGYYRVGGTWSGQFGPGNGFTTLSVVDDEQRLMAFPAYTDTELEGGRVVKPDVDFATISF